MVEHLTASAQLSSPADLESADQVAKVFEWSDSSEEEQEDSRLLKEFRTKYKVLGTKQVKVYNTKEQPAFHERNKSFAESYCSCCLGPQQSYDLSR